MEYLKSTPTNRIPFATRRTKILLVNFSFSTFSENFLSVSWILLLSDSILFPMANAPHHRGKKAKERFKKIEHLGDD